MRIETDLSVFTNKELGLKEDVFLGSTTGHEIRIAPNNAILLIRTYAHEVGHVLSRKLSFKSDEVMQPNEVKQINQYIELNSEEIAVLESAVLCNQVVTLSPPIIDIANKLLTKFTKGNFDPNEISVKELAREAIPQYLKNKRVLTHQLNQNGELVSINSKRGRNLELPSITTEAGCLQLLENTMKYYRLLPDKADLVIRRSASPSHQRAKNIISRAYQSQDWHLPSLVDIYIYKSRN